MLLIALALILIAWLFYNLYFKRLGLPPGPIPLPLIGNLHEFIKHPPGDQIQLEWRKKYGSLFTFWVGNRSVVAVADYQLIMETFQKDAEAYAGRANETEYMNLLVGWLN
jgi:cytochrome P450